MINHHQSARQIKLRLGITPRGYVSLIPSGYADHVSNPFCRLAQSTSPEIINLWDKIKPLLVEGGAVEIEFQDIGRDTIRLNAFDKYIGVYAEALYYALSQSDAQTETTT